MSPDGGGRCGCCFPPTRAGVGSQPPGKAAWGRLLVLCSSAEQVTGLALPAARARHLGHLPFRACRGKPPAAPAATLGHRVTPGAGWGHGSVRPRAARPPGTVPWDHGFERIFHDGSSRVERWERGVCVRRGLNQESPEMRCRTPGLRTSEPPDTDGRAQVRLLGRVSA